MAGDLSLFRLHLALGAGGLSEVDSLLRSVGTILQLSLLQCHLVRLKDALCGMESIKRRLYVAGRDSRILVGQLDFLGIPREHRIRTGERSAGIHVRDDCQLPYNMCLLVDSLLVLADLFPDLSQSSAIGCDLLRCDGVLLLISADLQLLLDQLLGDGFGLRFEVSDLIRRCGSGNEDHRQGGRSDESREKCSQENASALHSCVKPQLRGEPGARHCEQRI